MSSATTVGGSVLLIMIGLFVTAGMVIDVREYEPETGKFGDLLMPIIVFPLFAAVAWLLTRAELPVAARIFVAIAAAGYVACCGLALFKYRKYRKSQVAQK